MDHEARTRESEETGTESEMTEGTEEIITDPEERPCKAYKKRSAKKIEGAEKETTTSIYSVESCFAIRAEKVAACSCKRLSSISGRMGKSLKGSRQGSRFAASLQRTKTDGGSQQTICVRIAMRTNTRTPRTNARLRLSSVEPTRLCSVIMLQVMPKRLNSGSAKTTIVRSVR